MPTRKSDPDNGRPSRSFYRPDDSSSAAHNTVTPQDVLSNTPYNAFRGAAYLPPRPEPRYTATQFHANTSMSCPSTDRTMVFNSEHNNDDAHNISNTLEQPHRSKRVRGDNYNSNNTFPGYAHVPETTPDSTARRIHALEERNSSFRSPFLAPSRQRPVATSHFNEIYEASRTVTFPGLEDIVGDGQNGTSHAPYSSMFEEQFQQDGGILTSTPPLSFDTAYNQDHVPRTSSSRTFALGFPRSISSNDSYRLLGRGHSDGASGSEAAVDPFYEEHLEGKRKFQDPLSYAVQEASAKGVQDQEDDEDSISYPSRLIPAAVPTASRSRRGNGRKNASTTTKRKFKRSKAKEKVSVPFEVQYNIPPMPDYSSTTIKYSTSQAAKDAFKNRLAQNSPEDDDTVPQNDADRIGYVQWFTRALQNNTDAKDKLSKAYKARWADDTKNAHDEEDLEATAWAIQDAMELYHTEGFSAFKMYDRHFHPFIRASQHLKFRQRAIIITTILAEYKTRCDNLFKNKTIEQIVLAPLYTRRVTKDNGPQNARRGRILKRSNKVADDDQDTEEEPCLEEYEGEIETKPRKTTRAKKQAKQHPASVFDNVDDPAARSSRPEPQEEAEGVNDPDSDQHFIDVQEAMRLIDTEGAILNENETSLWSNDAIYTIVPATHQGDGPTVAVPADRADAGQLARRGAEVTDQFRWTGEGSEDGESDELDDELEHMDDLFGPK